MFPSITHIDDVLPHLLGRPEFIIKRDDVNGYTIINYMVSLSDTFLWAEDPDISPQERLKRQILRECRGITFSLKTGAIRARKFHKFKNIGEAPETNLQHLDFSQPHHILEKLDGSMITPYFNGDYGNIIPEEIQFHSKMGATFLTPLVGAYLKEYPHIAEWCTHEMSRGNTPIFEFCSRKNRIIIDHPRDRLVLLAIRHNITGQYVNYDTLEAARQCGIDVVESLPDSVSNILMFMEGVRNLTDQEGYVICFDSGLRLKCKSDQYLHMHRAKDLILHEKNVLFLVVTDTIDDVIPLLSDTDKQRVLEYASAVHAGMMNTSRILQSMSDAGISMDQKTFATQIANPAEGPLKTLLFLIRNGVDPWTAVKDMVKNNCSTEARVAKIRSLFSLGTDTKW